MLLSYNVYGDNMKKGFTLVELIAVVVLMALIALIVFPNILNSFIEKKQEISNYKKDLIYNATELYMSDKLNTYPQDVGATYCILLSTIDREGKIGVEIDDVLDEYDYVRVKIGVGNNNSYNLVKADSKEDCLQ